MRARVAILWLVLSTSTYASTANSVTQLTSYNGNGQMLHLCTVFSIHETKHFWMTALHCYRDQPDKARHIGGEATKLVVKDPAADIAIVSTVYVSAPALRLAKRGAKIGDEVSYYGFPVGIPFAAKNVMGNPDTHFDSGPEPYRRAIYALASAVGASGAPVVNKHGEVVSMLQTTHITPFAGFATGAPYEVIARWRQYFESEDVKP